MGFVEKRVTLAHAYVWSTSVTTFVSYSANRMTDRQTDRQTERGSRYSPSLGGVNIVLKFVDVCRQ